MAINSGKIRKLLEPGLAGILSEMPQFPLQFTEVFNTYESHKAQEQDVEMRLVSMAAIKPQGTPVDIDDNMGERFVTTYTHVEVANSFIITQIALEDNLYEDMFPMSSYALKKSMETAKDTLAASIINNAANPAFPIGDGQPLLSLTHPVDTGVYANTPTIPQQLNEAAIESALIAIQTQFVDQAGLKVNTKAVKLLVPPGGQFTAERLLKSEFRTGSTVNDVSAIFNMRSIPKGYVVNQYITNQQGWGIITDAPHGFKHFLRRSLESKISVVPQTNDLVCQASERYAFGNSNARSFYGVF